MTMLETPLDGGISQRVMLPDLVSMFRATVAARATSTAVQDSDGRMTLTYAALWERAQRLAAGLAAWGVGRGHTVGLMMNNRPEFFPADIAAICIGATPFSLYNSASPVQLVQVLNDAGCRLVVCERAYQPALEEARRLGVALDRLVVVDGDGLGGTSTLDDLERAGQPGFDITEAMKAVRPDDVATLIYTSGSTGAPKGVELTHANLVAEVRAINGVVPQIEDGSCISVLPAAHIGDRARSYYGSVLAFGHTVTTVAHAADLLSTMKAVRPTYFGNPPRTWEKIRSGLETRFGKDVADRAASDPGFSEELRVDLGLDRVLWISTGSAPTQRGQFEFFEAFGVRLCELWGMTETCAIATTNTPNECRFGSVGKAVSGLELRLAADGELLARGPTVASRYRNRPDATTEAFDADGWFHTGDLAECDDDGYWWIIGRKKDIIINAAGKNMSPINIESALKGADSVIMQACAIGDRRPYNVALIVVDPSVAEEAETELRDRVQNAVDVANATLSRVEQIKRFALIRNEWLAGGEELTPTMKLKRAEIERKYRVVIDDLYAQAAPSGSSQ